MVLLMKADYKACLRTVNNLLSRIPRYALYISDGEILSSNESKSLYEYIYEVSNNDIIERSKTSWLMDLKFSKDMLDSVPLAIHEELSFCDPVIGVRISPFVFGYYLMILCYHELRQYGDRDRALRLLVDVVNNPEQHGRPYHSLNIAGHCLLLAGQRDRAREMFIRSYKETQMFPPLDKYNSALHYLQKTILAYKGC